MNGRYGVSVSVIRPPLHSSDGVTHLGLAHEKNVATEALGKYLTAVSLLEPPSFWGDVQKVVTTYLNESAQKAERRVAEQGGVPDSV